MPPRASEILAGSVRAASRLISEIERGEPEARACVCDLYAACGHARLVGITGPPGAGKSTLVAALITELRRRGLSVGVIAVDPSSPFTGGALLGDRDRMLDASGDAAVFIRSLAARGAAGGLSVAVNDAVDVMDAMGKDVVLVETVGVGQGELDIAGVAHTVVLVVVPGYGDQLQAMKAGILEIADVVAVNKGDLEGAEAVAQNLRTETDVPVLVVSARRADGVARLADAMLAHAAPEARAAAERKRRARQFAFRVGERFREAYAADAEAIEFFQARVNAHPYTAADEFVAKLTEGVT